MKKVGFTTLGCKVNQYDTDAMKGLFLKAGYEAVEFEELADIYVINTCSVTHVGERKSRQLIRQAKRRNEDAIIVVTGCYAQLDPEAISAIEGVNLVIGTNNRQNVVNMVEELQSTEAQINAVTNIMQESNFEEMTLYGDAVEKARAFMKIQEGCDNFCTFCIIPFTRGKLKSRLLPDIIKEARQLVEFGYKEIVLTGIHLGNYGVDLKDDINLSDVVKALLEIKGLERIRLGSIESVEVSDELIKLMINDKRVCAHLHLPLQSGCDRILKKMYRHYNLAEFENLLNTLRKSIPNLAITTDIIVGFPGETDADFEETIQSVKKFGFTHIHAFPYSMREGTPAAKMKEQVPMSVKKARVAVLNKLAKETLAEYGKQIIGTKATILIEQEKDGYYLGFTDEYIHGKIVATGKNFKIGDLVEGTITTMKDGTFYIEV